MSLASTWGHAGWPGVLPGQIAAMQLGSNFALKALPVVALLALAASAQAQTNAVGWRSLFNGQDLAGWTVQCQPQDRDKIFWKAEQGAILCDSPSLPDARMDPIFKPAQFIFKYAGDADGWNEFTLICRGTRVRTILNGVVRTDWDGAGVLDNAAHRRHNVGRTGHFAPQLHSGDELRIRFKDIEVREF